jgi:two-component system, cell cycle sensor histidine kinase and response regulator CckA
MAFQPDKTEGKRADPETQLRLSEEKFSKAFAASPAAIVITRLADGHILDANDSYLKLLAYSREELVGKTTIELGIISPQDRAQMVQILAEHGLLRDREVELRKKTGEAIQVVYSSETIELMSEPCLISIAQDVTERKRAEEKLRESEDRYRSVVELSPEAILVNEGGRIAFANSACARLLGAQTAAEILGRSPFDFIRPDYHQPEREAIATLLERGGRSPLSERQFVRIDGSTVDVETVASVLPFQGRPAIQVFVRDITERKRMEAALRQSEEQLRQAQKMEAIGQLAGGVAHDFNNLLTGILGFSDLVLASLAPNDPSREPIEEIRKAGEQAASLTQQLLAFSRKQISRQVVFTPNTTVSQMRQLLRRLIGEHIELVTILDPALGTVKGDPGQLEQVIVNLALNARDAMTKGGKLTLTTSNVAPGPKNAELPGGVDYVLLSLTDTGCGMDPATKTRLFEPFFTTKEIGKGTGLGLATVYGIVKQAGGHIEVESELGKGATFSIYLPRVHEKNQGEQSASGLHKSPMGQETILLVEDDEIVRNLAEMSLERCGYRLLVAKDGKDALRLAGEHKGPIHLLVSDVVMPGMGGRAVAEDMKTLRPDIKILYVSGYPTDEVVRQGILEATMPFLQKPFKPVQLARKVREVLDA